MSTNLDIYNRMSEPPKSALKTITGGKLKNFTDINPQWRYKVMTEVFGMVGFGWKYTIDRTWLETAANGEITAFAQVSVYVKQNDQWSDAIVGVGGSKLVARERDGLATNDEAYKMAVTDAFSTSLKMLGVAGAIYEGRWDGSKYSQISDTKASTGSDRPKQNPVNAGEDASQLITKVETYITNGTLSNGFAKRARECIDTKDIQGLKDCVAYVESQAKKGA